MIDVGSEVDDQGRLSLGKLVLSSGGARRPEVAERGRSK